MAVDPVTQTLVARQVLHSDGSLWARGHELDGAMHGFWEWFRKGGGPIMRSGHFESGVQVGEWTTYDKAGAVYKTTVMKPKKAKN